MDMDVWMERMFTRMGKPRKIAPYDAWQPHVQELVENIFDRLEVLEQRGTITEKREVDNAAPSAASDDSEER